MDAQYGVELDVPAATILSIFGLRAQVRSPNIFVESRLMRGGFVVFLVAEHFAAWNFLCGVHSGELFDAALLCQGEAVKGEVIRYRECLSSDMFECKSSTLSTQWYVVTCLAFVGPAKSGRMRWQVFQVLNLWTTQLSTFLYNLLDFHHRPQRQKHGTSFRRVALALCLTMGRVVDVRTEQRLDPRHRTRPHPNLYFALTVASQSSARTHHTSRCTPRCHSRILRSLQRRRPPHRLGDGNAPRAPREQPGHRSYTASPPQVHRRAHEK